eukprot:TRINITY_DN34612_c0_g2_i1.p2 TRINITY_DN34612_c0_g2~~TRINITY_DN34612_c0_g2_i1.p2  ORF type:complete len:168 (+),score=51.44 TRINITY_DN34612_c0_g2_i1:65-568(+)
MLLCPLAILVLVFFFFFFSSRRRHTRCREVSWARRCVQETGINAEYMGMKKLNDSAAEAQHHKPMLTYLPQKFQCPDEKEFCMKVKAQRPHNAKAPLLRVPIPKLGNETISGEKKNDLMENKTVEKKAPNTPYDEVSPKVYVIGLQSASEENREEEQRNNQGQIKYC